MTAEELANLAYLRRALVDEFVASGSSTQGERKTTRGDDDATDPAHLSHH